jgi:hypothetical protein
MTTIVIYTTDNGPNMFTWPDAAMIWSNAANGHRPQ